MYDQKKLKEFYESTIEDYNRNLRVEDIAVVQTVERADNSFTQIGMRPLIGEDMFIDPGFSPRLPSAGMMVAVGEEDFLIKSILDNKEIERIEMKEDVKEFPKYAYDYNNAVILLSTKFFVKIFTQLMNRIAYGGSHPILDVRYRIISIPEKMLGSRVIIIGKNAILWEKELFLDKTTGKKEKIDIMVKPASIGNVEITLRSVNKIKYIDKELIKILEVTNEILV
jgi:hypothetical protein